MGVNLGELAWLSAFVESRRSASASTVLAGVSLTAWAVLTARSMSSLETPSFLALSKWNVKQDSQLEAIDAPIAISSAIASV